MDAVNRTREYLEKNGVKDTFFTGLQHIKNLSSDLVYDACIRRKNRPEVPGGISEEDMRDFKLSVLVPVFEPDYGFLEEMTASVLNQSWDNFELILADGSPAEDLRIRKLARCDERIRYIRSIPGGGISENTNAALKAAKGKAVAFLDQDDFIEEDALYLIASEFLKGADIVYTDEDKFLTGENRYACAYRKRDYSPQLLLSNNYICHMFAVKRTLAKKAGEFDLRFDGAQDHDFILRCCDLAGADKIFHIKKILYHWRAHESSTAANPKAKLYAYESGKKAVQHFLKKKRINALVKDTEHAGFFRVEYQDEIPSDKYCVFADKNLIPLNKDYEKILSSYFSVDDIGIVGARVISPFGRIIESGYEKDETGRIRPLFYGKDYRMPGAFNLATLVMDTEAVSKYACVVRKELVSCMQGNSWKICEKIRKKGYRVVIDPGVVFIRK